MTKITILDFLRSHKDEMHEKFGLIKIGLFGSYVRGEQREDSDIDLAVGIESSIKPMVQKYIENEIEYA